MDSIPLSKDGSVHVTDERISTISHLAAACFALVGAALLITEAAMQGDPWKIVGLAAFGAGAILLFSASALHHGIEGSPRTNAVLRTLDYAAVFALIAGTVTPLVLVLFRNAFGWTVLGAVWVIAIAGIVVRSVFPSLPKYVTSTLYIVLGWIPVLLVASGVALPFGAYALLAAGGIAYSIGFVIFVAERPNPVPGKFGFHEIWHLLVVLAAFLHYLLMYFYVLPA